jgi:hypothetical protein
MQLHVTGATTTPHLITRTRGLRRAMPVAAATAMMAVCSLLASGTPALAQSGPGAPQSGEARCSNRTLSGDYGCSTQGVLLLTVPGLPPEVQFVGVTMNSYDGNGHLTWVEHTVIGGQVSNAGWLSASGTYTVNPDCTGTAVVDTPNSPVPLNFAFVVTDKGHEIRAVLDSNALVTVCRRVR